MFSIQFNHILYHHNSINSQMFVVNASKVIEQSIDHLLYQSTLHLMQENIELKKYAMFVALRPNAAPAMCSHHILVQCQSSLSCTTLHV
mmetsp:Transcript_21616/g.32083  ORF Transcript_21616/g.32083 Transcript_21616/m.32083 type:complete len:89 (-) Transcript_21616:1270-1536(-)